MNTYIFNIFIFFIFLYTINVQCRHDVVHLNHTTWLKESKNCIIFGAYGESITLIIEGFNANYSFDWFFYKFNTQKFSRKLKFENEETLYIQHNSTHTNLTIKGLSWEHRGIYSTFYSEKSTWSIFTLIVDYTNKTVLFARDFHYFQNSDYKRNITCAVFNSQNEDVVFQVCKVSDKFFYVCDNSSNIKADMLVKPNYSNGFVKYILKYTYEESKTLTCNLPSQDLRQFIHVYIGLSRDYFLIKAKNFNIDFENNGIIEIPNENELHLDCLVLDDINCLALDCLVDDYIQPLQWYINDQLINENSIDNGYHITKRKKVIFNARYTITTLIISTRLSNKMQTFSCEAELHRLNHFNSHTYFRNVSIMFKNVVHLNYTAWIKNSQNIKIFARRESSVTFLIEGFDRNYLFHWYKLNTDMMNSIKLEMLGFKSKYYIENKNHSLSLTITDLSSKDTGQYRTLIDSKNISSSFIELVVSDVIFITHSQWLKEFRTIQIFRKIGETITLIINGFNEKYAFDWFKYENKTNDFTKLEEEGKHYIANNGNTSNLTITNLSWKDNGKYTTFYSKANKWIIFELVISIYEPFTKQNFNYFFDLSYKPNFVICLVPVNYFKKVTLKIEQTNSKPNFIRLQHESSGAAYFQPRNVYCSGFRENKWIDSYPFKVYEGPFPDFFVISLSGNMITFFQNSGVIEAATNKSLKIDCIIVYDTLDVDEYIKWLVEGVYIKNNSNYNVVRTIQNRSNIIYLYETLEIYPIQEEVRKHFKCTAKIIPDKTIVTREISVIFKDKLDKNSTVSNPSILPVQGTTLIWIIITIVLVTILLFILLVGIIKRLKKRRSQRIINEFEMTETFNPEIPIQDFVSNLQYDKRLEFSKKKLILGKTLGYGHFGIVRKALALGIVNQNVKTLVAVKCVKDPGNIEALRCLISEMKIMVHVGKHLNIVNILGAITKNIAKGNLMIIFEYCAYGNLEQFLRNHRKIFVSQIDPRTDEIKMENDPEYLNRESATNTLLPSKNAYLEPNLTKNQFPSKFKSTNHEDEKNIEHNDSMKPYSILTTTDLICWAYQITLGMNYISKRNIMHGDLAARNILLTEDNIVKICDFGLAKTISNQYSHYIKKEEDQLPLKWLAIESLQDLKFSIQSDIWSFGVLLWELFSFGSIPYPGVNAKGIEFLNLLKNGYRMEKPENANEKIYNIMLSCWESVPTNRPKFSELQEKIADFFNNDTYMRYIEMNKSYEKANIFYNSTPKSGEYLVMLRIPNKIKAEYVNVQNESNENAPILTENIK